MSKARPLAAAFLALTLGTACSAPALVSIRWRTVEVSPDQRGLITGYALDRCQRVDHAEVVYAETRLVVTLLAKQTKDTCLGRQTPKSLVIPLHEPLAGRVVTDGAK